MMSEIKFVKVFILIISSQLFRYIYASSSESDDNNGSKVTIFRLIKDDLYEQILNFSRTENEFSLPHQYTNLERSLWRYIKNQPENTKSKKF